jgi:hypothetical protein
MYMGRVMTIPRLRIVNLQFTRFTMVAKPDTKLNKI